MHRLLKNSVPVPEYVLMSDELYRDGGTASAEPAVQQLEQDLEGIGRVTAHYMDVADLAGPLGPLPDPSWPRRIGGTFAMVGRGIPYVIHRQRPRSLTSVG